MRRKDKLRVNLGSGTDYLKGWVNVDVDTTQRVDVIADLNSTFPFKDNSVDEIKASDILEHFTKEDGERFLKECYRVLKLGGTIFLRTHNPYQIIKQFGHDPEVMFHFLYGNTSGTGIFGAHKYAYTEKSLRKIAGLIGFDIQSIKKEDTNFVILLTKRQIDHFLSVKYIHDKSHANNLLMKDVAKENTSVRLSAVDYAVSISFTRSLVELLLSVIIIPYVFAKYYKQLKLYQKDSIDLIILDGFSEKIVMSWVARFCRMPVIWLETEILSQKLNTFLFIPKILYRLTKEIPEYVLLKDEKTKQLLMREGRVSLSKLYVVPRDATRYTITELLVLTKYSK